MLRSLQAVAVLWLRAGISNPTAAKAACIEPAVDLDLQAIYYSNLDGTGPSANAPTAIRYGRVVQVRNTLVDMTISAQGPYKATNVNHNFNSGKCRQIGNINLATGNAVNLTFAFVRHRQQELVKLPHVHLTFFLVDSREAVSVSHFDSFCVSNDSSLRVEETGSGATRFSLKPPDPGGRLHISSPSNLTNQERARAVTFRFRDVAEVPVQLEALGPEDGGLDFSFAGTSPLEKTGHGVCWATAADIGDALVTMAGATSTPEPFAMSSTFSAASSTSTMAGMSTTPTHATWPGILSSTSTTSTTTTTSTTATTTSRGDPFAGGSSTEGTSRWPLPVWGVDELGDVFHCNRGLPVGWDPGKKFWCCKYHNRGCAGASPTTSGPLSFDCSVDSEFGLNDWSTTKRVWCCQNRGRGCLTTISPPEMHVEVDTGGPQPAPPDALEPGDRPAPSPSPSPAIPAPAPLEESPEATEPPTNVPEGTPAPFPNPGPAPWPALGPPGQQTPGMVPGSGPGSGWQEPQLHECLEATWDQVERWNERAKAFCCQEYGQGCSESTTPMVTSPKVYVRIEMTRPEPLTIFEVQAFSGNGQQIPAISAEMGSVEGSQFPSRCIDGFEATACQTRSTEGKNWLAVSFPEKPHIAGITVVSRDNGAVSLIPGAVVKLTTDRAGHNSVWSRQMVGVHGKYSFSDIAQVLVYVRVEMTRPEALSLREVEAFASDGSELHPVSVQMGSSAGPAFSAEHCIDGLQSTHCRTSNALGQNWLRVAYAAEPEVASVTLSGPGDGGVGLEGARVKVSTDEVGHQEVWSDVLAGARGTYHFTGLARRKVFLRLENPDATALILNEVEAFNPDGVQIPALSSQMGSTHGSFIASRCIDGLSTTQCQTSFGIGQNWLLVAFPADASIASLKIIGLGKEAQSSTKGTIVKIATEESGSDSVWSRALDGTRAEYHFSDIVPQVVYVRIDMANSVALNLAEVEAFAANQVKIQPFAAAMGSTNGTSIARRCIDGLQATACRTRKALGQNWLTVSYPASSEIVSIRLVPVVETASGPSSLDGATIKLGTSLEGLHPVWVTALMGTQKEYYFRDIIKRLVFIRVDMPKADALSLSEVEAFDAGGTKISAFYARQGSTAGARIASRCIDGSMLTSCQTESMTGKNWILVAYPTRPGISSIRLTSHNAVTSAGLDGASVRLVTDPIGHNAMWSRTLSGVQEVYQFSDIAKHLVYMRIDMAELESLSLDEVAAFGKDGVKLMPISATMGSAYGSWDASRCIDGLMSTVCRTKAANADHWLVVVYPAEPDIYSIILTSHAAGKENQIAGATIKLSTDEAGLNVLWSNSLSGAHDVYRFTDVVANKAPTSKPYDCLVGSSNWESLWSHSKRDWCCQRFSVGCPGEAVTTQEPYDCHTGSTAWQVLWSARRKQWCCARYLKGCEVSTTHMPTSAPFDCQAGLSNWRAGWSVQKQQWCCQRYRLGCPGATTTEPFDCEAGLANWARGWSREKKAWCCRVHQKGCGTVVDETPSVHECFSGPSTQWTCAKRHRCCMQHQQGCQLAWCCHHEGVGCQGSDVISMQRLTEARPLRASQEEAETDESSRTWNEALRKFEMTEWHLPHLDTFMVPSVLGSIGLAATVLLAMHTWSGSPRSQPFGCTDTDQPYVPVAVEEEELE